MKTGIAVTLVVVLSSGALPALADGHIEGRLKGAAAAGLDGPGKAFEKNGVIQATRIVGDKGKGNGNEPALGFDDHDPGIVGGNGGDPDTE